MGNRSDQVKTSESQQLDQQIQFFGAKKYRKKRPNDTSMNKQILQCLTKYSPFLKGNDQVKKLVTRIKGKKRSRQPKNNMNFTTFQDPDLI
mmetsp:Transcript_41793/g.40146  ORF Transcript_41793/g.40146 Transcript_41793/m.40146 type:complete len:91 (+) Transcript_41793:1297-1569(+)